MRYTIDYKYLIHYSDGRKIPANMPDHIQSLRDWREYYRGVIFEDPDGKPYIVENISRR